MAPISRGVEARAPRRTTAPSVPCCPLAWCPSPRFLPGSATCTPRSLPALEQIECDDHTVAVLPNQSSLLEMLPHLLQVLAYIAFSHQGLLPEDLYPWPPLPPSNAAPHTSAPRSAFSFSPTLVIFNTRQNLLTYSVSSSQMKAL